MLKLLLLLLFVLAMIPVIYVLFFTQTVDKFLMKMRIGRRASSLESTVASMDAVVREAVEDLKVEKIQVDKALQTAAKITQMGPVKTIETHPWVIRHREFGGQYWSDKSGWVALRDADMFDAADHITVSLPSSGIWYRRRKSKAAPSKES